MEKIKDNFADKSKREQQIPAQDSISETVEEEMENVVCELITKRESNVKHFKMKDNTISAVFFEDDVHYWDNEKQCYEEIDNTLERTTDKEHDCYVTRSGAYKAQFGATADSSKLFKIERHGCSASWRFCDVEDNQGGAAKFRSVRGTAKAQAQKNKSYISYDNIFNGVDLEYIAEPYRVKENIIIRQKQAQYNYLLYFSVEGADIEVNGEGGLDINNKETGETEFQMPAPFMIDSDNRRSDDVYYEIEKTDDNGNYTLRIAASANWINSEERSLPVRIDPQILIPRLEIEQTLQTINRAPKENEPEETWENFKESVTYIGQKDQRTYKRYINFKLANSSALVSEITIKDVLIQTTIVNDNEMVINMRPFTLDSKGDINWTGTTIDSRRIKRDENENAKAAVYHFDYTGRLSATEKNYIYFEAAADVDGQYVTMDRTIKIIVNYTVDNGISPEKSYSSHKTGIGSQAMISLKEGRLHHIFTDTQLSGNKIPFDLYHVFDFNQTAQPYIYPCAYGSYTYNSSNAIDVVMGAGWKINLVQWLYNIGPGQYVYCDENDYEYLLLSKEDAEHPNLYVDTLNKGYEFNYKTNTLKRDGLYYLFNRKTNVLTHIFDENSNYIEIRYDDKFYRKISKIIDSAGRVYSFLYDFNNLAQILLPDGNSISYTYSEYRAKYKLMRIDFSIGYSINYEYDTSFRITKCYYDYANTNQRDGYVYTYLNGKLSQLKEYHATVTNNVESNLKYGKTTNYSYANLQTAINNTAADSETASLFTYYHLDSNGKVAGMYCKDNNNQKVFIPSMDLNGVNFYDCTPSFEINGYPLKTFNPLDFRQFLDGTEVSGTKFKTEGYIFESSILTNDNIDAVKYMKREETLPPGNYTLSAFIKYVNPVVSDAKGAYMSVEVGSKTFRTDYMREEADYERQLLNFTVGETTTVKICIGLEKSTGELLVDLIQIYQEEYCNINYVELLKNGDMEKNVFDYYEWKTSEAASGAYIDSGFEGKCVRLTANPETEECFIEQSFFARSGMTDQYFILSGMAKANVPILKEDQKFELRVELYSELHKLEEEHSVSFGAHIDNWQYRSLSFKKETPLPIKDIKVFLDFSGHQGSVCFDNIHLMYYADQKNNTGGSIRNGFVEEEEPAAREEDFEVKDRFGNYLGSQIGDGTVAVYSSTEYTADGNNISTETDERGNKTYYDFDPVTDNVTAVYAPERSPVNYLYDDADQKKLKKISASIDGTELKNEFEYDYRNNLSSISGNTAAYNFTYDDFGNPATVKAGNILLNAYTFKENTGKLSTMQYADGSIMTLTYDRLGRVVNEKWRNGATLEGDYSYVYDGDNNIIRSVDHTRRKIYNYRYYNGMLTESKERSYTTGSDGEIIITASESEDETINITTDEFGTQQGDGAYMSVGYDTLGRLDSREFTFGQGKAASAKYYYHDGEADGKAFNKLNGRPSTNLVSKIKYSDKSSLEYEYDKSGNIKEIYTDGELTQRYGYDGTGRLIRDDDAATGLTTLYSYDAGGNILEKKEYACTWDEPSGTPSVKTYTYDAVWKDRLTGYTGYKSTASFKGGNPDSYNGFKMTWEKGRQLKSITQPVNPTEVQAWRNVTYEYNANGIRAGKTIDTIEHKYYLLGRKILLETINDGGSVNTLQYLYDNSEEVSGISYNGTEYCYVKNLQGDVIRVIDSNGECVVKYVYNSWGKVIEVTDAQGNTVTSSTHIGNINPIRYRSYYYDPETKYYYLQSRYYDPETGRFLNADDVRYLQPDMINGLNLNAYARNNPVMNLDPDGHKWYEFWEWDWGKIAGWVVTGILAIAATAAVIAGTVFTGGLLGAVLVGAGIGAMAGIAGNITLQGGIQNIGNINPWKVALTGVIGGAIGAATGAFSYGISVMGAAAGQSFGYALSQSVIGGLKVSKVFSVALLMGAGKFVGGIAGGLIGTAIGDYFVNTAQGKPTTFGGIIKSESSSWITDFIRWLLS